MEQVLLRTLMNKDFYDSNRGERCPETLFSTEGRKIKRTIDEMIDQYNRDLTPEEVRSYFVSANPSMTTCLLYTSPSPRDGLLSRMPSSA